MTTMTMTKKKFQLTEERHKLHNLRRIQAVRDIPEIGVREGELGGWIESEKNLSHEGTGWVFGDAIVMETAEVRKNARVCGNARVLGNARVTGEAVVAGEAIVSDNARVAENATVTDNARVAGNARVYGNAWVAGRAVVYGTSAVGKDAKVAWAARLTGDARVREPRHLLTTVIHLGAPFAATLFRTRAGHLLRFGWWKGTVDEFREMIEGEGWLGNDKAARETYRPELLAFADMCQARVQTW